MSKYSLKFTTIKEWKPELLSEDENPDNPICLIVNESQEAIAMLVPHVDKTLTESYIFQSDDNTKIFKTLEEACEYVGLPEDDDNCFKFVNTTKEFILTEQARLEQLNPYYDGIHTPYNDALRLYKAKRLYSEEVLTEDLITHRTNFFEPSDGYGQAASDIFNVCKKYLGTTILIFNNQAYLDSNVATSGFRLLIENFQCKFSLSEIYAIGRDNNGNVVKTFNEVELKNSILPLFNENIGHLGFEDNRNVTVNDINNDMTIVISLKNVDKDNITKKDLSFDNVVIGYKLTTTSNSGTKSEDIILFNANNKAETINKIEKAISTEAHFYQFEKGEGEGEICTLSNGLTVSRVIINNSYALTIYKGNEIINKSANNADVVALFKKGLPPIQMRLNNPTIMNILNSIEQMSFSDKPKLQLNQFYDEKRFDSLFDDLHDEVVINFNKNNLMAKIEKSDDGYYMNISPKQQPEISVFDGFYDLDQKDELRQILNKYISAEDFQAKEERIIVSQSDPDLTEKDIFSHYFPLNVEIRGKKPHNLTAIVKNIGKDDKHKSLYTIVISEQSNYSNKKEDTYYDTNIEDFKKSDFAANKYPALQQYLSDKKFEFPTTDKKQIVDCLNFIKNADIGTTSTTINNIINSEGNKDKDIRYIFPSDVSLTAQDIRNDFKDKNEGDSVYYVFSRKTQIDGRNDLNKQKSSDITDSVIVVTLTNKEKEMFSYDYNQYSEKADEELGYKPFELKPIFRKNRETGNLEQSSHLHTDQTIDDLVKKFEETQNKTLTVR